MSSRRLRDDFCELFVFVYGTLKPGGRYHSRFCSQGLVSVTPGLVKGRLYDFPALGYPAMSRGDGWVKGYLLKFAGAEAKCSEILRRLDVLEGYEGRGANNEYERYEVQAFSVEGKPMHQAWLYVMDDALIRLNDGVFLPSGDWPIML